MIEKVAVLRMNYLLECQLACYKTIKPRAGIMRMDHIYILLPYEPRQFKRERKIYACLLRYGIDRYTGRLEFTPKTQLIA